MDKLLSTRSICVTADLNADLESVIGEAIILSIDNMCNIFVEDGDWGYKINYADIITSVKGTSYNVNEIPIDTIHNEHLNTEG